MLLDEKDLQKVLANRLGKKLNTDELRDLIKEVHQLGKEWQEVEEVPSVVGASISVQCEDICVVGEALKKGEKVRLFRLQEDD